MLPLGHEPFGSELKAELLKAEWHFFIIILNKVRWSISLLRRVNILTRLRRVLV